MNSQRTYLVYPLLLPKTRVNCVDFGRVNWTHLQETKTFFCFFSACTCLTTTAH